MKKQQLKQTKLTTPPSKKRTRDVKSDQNVAPPPKRTKKEEEEASTDFGMHPGHYAGTPWLYLENAIPTGMHERIFLKLFDETKNLQQRQGAIMGIKYLEPRLSQLYSTDGHAYMYSGVFHKSKLIQLVPELMELIEHVKKVIYDNGHIPVPFNTALVNHYRAATPNDGVMKHSDKDGLAHTIASISLGGQRLFRIHQDGKIATQFLIKPRSVLLMFPGMQDKYQHEIVKPKDTPKKFLEEPGVEASLAQTRINVTLRVQ